MKGITIFFLKAISLTLLLSQVTTSDTGFALVSNPINEPLFLTICGVGLLALGMLGRGSQGA